MKIGEQLIWCEKYRPKTVKDTILPENLKKTFQQFVDDKFVPNLILSGTSGTGKTTVAKAMLDELGCDYKFINASLDKNIDVLRTEILQFASSVSFKGGKKYVILDEADYLNASSTQPALRAFIEQFPKNCGFIFTCNYKNRILPALHSRVSVVDFKIPKAEAVKIAESFFNVILSILDKEGITYDKPSVAAFINRFYPDFRRIINELQRYSASGSIDSGILSVLSDESFRELVGFLKEKNFTEIRKWAAENVDIETSLIFNKLYESSNSYMVPSSIPQLVLVIAKYQYQSSFVADQLINLIACLVEIMIDCKFR